MKKELKRFEVLEVVRNIKKYEIYAESQEEAEELYYNNPEDFDVIDEIDEGYTNIEQAEVEND